MTKIYVAVMYEQAALIAASRSKKKLLDTEVMDGTIRDLVNGGSAFIEKVEYV